MDKKKIIIIAVVAVIALIAIIAGTSNKKEVTTRDLAKIPSNFIVRIVYNQTIGPDASTAKNYYICKNGDRYDYTCFTYHVTIAGESDEVEIESGKIKNKNGINKIFSEIENTAQSLGGYNNTTIFLKDGTKLENKEALIDYLF